MAKSIEMDLDAIQDQIAKLQKQAEEIKELKKGEWREKRDKLIAEVKKFDDMLGENSFSKAKVANPNMKSAEEAVAIVKDNIGKFIKGQAYLGKEITKTLGFSIAGRNWGTATNTLKTQGVIDKVGDGPTKKIIFK